MTLPDWVAGPARTKMEPNEQIVEVQVLKEGFLSKLAVVQTSQRNLVVSGGVFGARAFDVVQLGERTPTTSVERTEVRAIQAQAPTRETEPPAVKPRLARAERPKAPEPASPDDLTTLSGVGKVRAERLNEAGITTFDQLVKADAAKLAEQLNVSADTVAGWQDAARNA